MNAYEAYVHLYKLLEKANSIIGSLIVRDLTKNNIEGKELDIMIEEKEKEYYFDPIKGNVIFSSALDCWGFTLNTFAEILSKKMGFKKEALVKYLWGEYYFNSKLKKVFSEPPLESSKPMFVEFILDNIYKLYKLVYFEKDLEKIIKAAENLKASYLKSDLNLLDKDPKPLLKVINYNLVYNKTMASYSFNSLFINYK